MTLKKCALIGTLSLLTGCSSSKVLNESRAKELIQEKLTVKVLASAQTLKPFMERSTNDWTTTKAVGGPALTLKRLINGRFVIQKSVALSYTVLSGTWVSKGNGDPSSERTIQLQMEPNSNVVRGVCAAVPNNGWFGSYPQSQFRGEMTTDDHLKTADSSACTGPIPLLYYVKGAEARLSDPHNTYIGTPSGKRVEVRWYDYSFTPEVMATVVMGMLPVGTYDVGQVSSLQLVTETHAIAIFAWRATLDNFGKLLCGDIIPSGDGTVEFAKKPDGTWMVVRLDPRNVTVI